MDETRESFDLDEHQPANYGTPKKTIEKVSLVGILVVLILFVLKIASLILVPLTLAILLSLLFAPLVNSLSKIGISKRIGSAAIVLALTGLLVGGIILLAEPTSQWLEKSPSLFHEIERKLNKLKEPMKQVQEAADKVEDLAAIDKKSQPFIVKLQAKKLSETVFVATPKFLAFMLLLIILLYFLLFSGGEVAEYLVHMISRMGRRECSIDMGHYIQQEISKYLFTIATINICLGVSIAIAMALIGLPNPILWGTMAAILNFAPYIGAICGTFVIAAVSFISFDQLSQILLAPGIFLVLTSLEGHIITPQVLGIRFSLNPLLLFLSMIFWGWMWGYIGALLAVPLLVIFKITCQSVDTLQPIADFLGGKKQEQAVQVQAVKE